MKRLFFLLVAFVILLSPASAVQVGEGVQFNTTGTGTSYYVATAFNATNITVYPTAWNINGGNITTYSNINMSMESLTDLTYLNFTNNATITNLTVTNNFANYTISNVKLYAIFYQGNNSRYDDAISTSEFVFENIPADSWYIVNDPLVLSTVTVTTILPGTGSKYVVSTNVNGASWLSSTLIGSVWSLSDGLELWTIIFGFVLLTTIILFVAFIIRASRGETDLIKHLTAMLFGAVILIVLVMIMPFLGDSLYEESIRVSDDFNIGTLTFTQATLYGQTVMIYDEVYTYTDGVPGAFNVDIGGNRNSTYSASQLVAEINANSTLVTAV